MDFFGGRAMKHNSFSVGILVRGQLHIEPRPSIDSSDSQH